MSYLIYVIVRQYVPPSSASSICPIVRQYVPLSYLASICPIVRQYVPLSYLVSICPIVRQYLPVLFTFLFFSPYVVHVGTCLLFHFPDLCYVLYVILHK